MLNASGFHNIVQLVHHHGVCLVPSRIAFALFVHKAAVVASVWTAAANGKSICSLDGGADEMDPNALPFDIL